MDHIWHAPPDSSDIVAYLHSIIPAESFPNPTISTYSDCVYHTYKPLGLSLCFSLGPNGPALTSVDVYNPTRSGFGRFPGSLPHGLNLAMRAEDVVRALGEPERKEGGRRTGVPCWVEWGSRGVHITFEGTNWDDGQMGIESITLFEPGTG